MMSNTIYPDLPEILVSLDADAIALVTLNRPEQRNTFTNQMKDSLVEAFRRLDNDDGCKVVVLQGAPNKGNAFCAGADLNQGDFSSSSANSKSSYNTAQNLNEHRDSGGVAALAAFKIKKPTIACINGHGVGIGITLPLAFDIRVAWKDAKIGFVFARRGIVPEAGSSYFLPRLIGHSRALELCMTGRILPASSPTLDLLFSSLHPTPEATVKAALDLAREIASQNSAISMAITKALIWRGFDSPEEQHLLDSKAVYTTGNSIDSKEGVKAFREKRAAKFQATIPKDLPTEYYPWWSVKDITRAKL